MTDVVSMYTESVIHGEIFVKKLSLMIRLLNYENHRRIREKCQ